MKVVLAFAPFGSDSITEGREFDVPTFPRPGDSICLHRPGREGQYFIVKQIVWQMKTSVSEEDVKRGRVMNEEGVTDGITIVCEHDPSN